MTYRQSVLQRVRYQLCHNEHMPLRVKWCLRILQYSCGCCSMLLPSLLFAAYENNRKEEVASMEVFHHRQRSRVWSVPSCQQIFHDGSYKFMSVLQESEDRVCVCDFNDACTYRIQRRIELMITQIPSLSLWWFIYKSDRYQHVNIRNRIANRLIAYRCNFTCFV